MDDSALCCSLDRNNRETHCISASGASTSFICFKAFFNALMNK